MFSKRLRRCRGYGMPPGGILRHCCLRAPPGGPFHKLPCRLLQQPSTQISTICDQRWTWWTSKITKRPSVHCWLPGWAGSLPRWSVARSNGLIETAQGVHIPKVQVNSYYLFWSIPYQAKSSHKRIFCPTETVVHPPDQRPESFWWGSPNARFTHYVVVILPPPPHEVKSPQLNKRLFKYKI